MKQAKLLTRTLAAAAITASMASLPSVTSAADLSASGGVANVYLFRGFDLGDGSPQVFGDITYTLDSGFYASAWISSGDDALGTETDFIIGWGGDIGGGFSADINVTNYYYSDAGIVGQNGNPAAGLNGQEGTFGDFTEIILSLSYAISDDFSVSLGYVDNVAGVSGADYTTVSAGYGPFSVLIGSNSEEVLGSDDDIVHVDLSYAFNDNVTFTVSKIVDGEENDDDSEAVDDDAIFVFAYSLPIDLN